MIHGAAWLRQLTRCPNGRNHDNYLQRSLGLFDLASVPCASRTTAAAGCEENNLRQRLTLRA